MSQRVLSAFLPPFTVKPLIPRLTPSNDDKRTSSTALQIITAANSPSGLSLPPCSSILIQSGNLVPPLSAASSTSTSDSDQVLKKRRVGEKPPTRQINPIGKVTDIHALATQYCQEAADLIRDEKYIDGLKKLKEGYSRINTLPFDQLDYHIEAEFLSVICHGYKEWQDIENTMRADSRSTPEDLHLMHGIHELIQLKFNAANKEFNLIPRRSTNYSLACLFTNIIEAKSKPRKEGLLRISLHDPSTSTVDEEQKLPNPQTPIQRLSQLVSQRRYPKAADLGMQILKELPDHSKVLTKTSIACWRSNRLVEALKCIDHLLTFPIKDIYIWLTKRAAINIQQHQYEEGCSTLFKAFDGVKKLPPEQRDDYFENNLLPDLMTSFTEDSKTDESLSKGFGKQGLLTPPIIVMLYGIFFYTVKKDRHTSIIYLFRALHALDGKRLYKPLTKDLMRFIQNKITPPNPFAAPLNEGENV